MVLASELRVSDRPSFFSKGSSLSSLSELDISGSTILPVVALVFTDDRIFETVPDCLLFRYSSC